MSINQGYWSIFNVKLTTSRYKDFRRRIPKQKTYQINTPKTILSKKGKVLTQKSLRHNLVIMEEGSYRSWKSPERSSFFAYSTWDGKEPTKSTSSSATSMIVTYPLINKINLTRLLSELYRVFSFRSLNLMSIGVSKGSFQILYI